MRYILSLLIAMYSFSAMATTKAIDGDSLEIGDSRIRLEGIDAPEYKQSCKNKYGKRYKCGKLSLQYLQKMIGKHKVNCKCEESPDIYGRKLCECYANGKNLNQQMVRKGWAVTYRSKKYKEDEEKARADRAGIWQGKFMRPALYRSLKREQKRKK